MTEGRAARRDPEGWLLRVWEEGAHPAVTTAMAALALGYRAALLARGRCYDLGLLRTGRLPCPVISIGNLTVGGSGKTPLVELAALTLAGLGATPGIVSRGYRRQTRGVHVVADREGIRLDAHAAGDEPVLLAERLPGTPVVVGENRYEAARVAVERLGATTIVLDDGFQNRTIAKDVEVLAVSSRSPWGNGRVFPAGPLREPLSALRRAHLMVITNGGEAADVMAMARTLGRHAATAPILTAGYQVVGVLDTARGERVEPRVLRGRRLLGFAGVAKPEGFRETLAGMGAVVAGFTGYPDHHWYAAEDVAALSARAEAVGAEGLVTTEKDWVRLRGLGRPRSPLWVVSVRMILESGQRTWLDMLKRTLSDSLAGA